MRTAFIRQRGFGAPRLACVVLTVFCVAYSSSAAAQIAAPAQRPESAAPSRPNGPPPPDASPARPPAPGRSFADLADFQLNGSAATLNQQPRNSNSRLRLTDRTWQSGSAVFKRPISVAGEESFRAFFQFQITEPTGWTDSDRIQGADGLAFILLTAQSPSLQSGGALGFSGTKPSLAIEFDTWNNGVVDGDNGNHIGVDVNGDLTSVARVAVPQPLNDGKPRFVWIEYDGRTDWLDVRIATSPSRPSAPTLTYRIDLQEIFGTARVFAGFSAGTGAAANVHEIVTWDLRLGLTPVARAPQTAAPRSPTVTSSIASRPDVVAIRAYEATSATLPSDFRRNDPRLRQRISGALTEQNRDFGFYPGENYDIYFSDRAGNPDPSGSYVTIEGICDEPDACRAGGFNIAEVALVFDGGVERFATTALNVRWGGETTTRGQDPGAALAVDGKRESFVRLGSTVGQAPTARMGITFGFDPRAPSTQAPPASALATAIVDEDWLTFWSDFIRTLPWSTTEVTRLPAQNAAYKLLVVSGEKLASRPTAAVRTDPAAPRVSYEVLSVATPAGIFNLPRAAAAEEFGRLERADYTGVWQKAWPALSASTGINPNTLQRRTAYLLLVKYRHGELPGRKPFTVGGQPAVWGLDRGITAARVRFVRPVRETERDELASAFFGDRVQLEVSLSAPTPIDRIELVIGSNGRPVAVGSRTTLEARRRSGGRNPAYMTEPFALLDATARVVPDEQYVRVAAGDRLHAKLTDDVAFRAPVTTIDIQPVPDAAWRWGAALQRAERAIPRGWDSSRPPTMAEAAELSDFVLFTTGAHFRSTVVRRGDLAAMLLLRDRFVGLMQAYLPEVRQIDSRREIFGFYKLIEPSIRDNTNALGRVPVANPKPLSVTGITPTIQLREVVADSYLREHLPGPGVARDFAIQKVGEALAIYVSRSEEALETAQRMRDSDVSSLLSLTGFGFERVAADLLPELVVPVRNERREVIGWEPDYVARAHVTGIATLGNTVRAQKELSQADAAVYMTAASLIPVVAPANLLRLVSSLALGAVDLSEAAGSWIRTEQEAAFELGAAAVLGTERLDAAEARQLPLWAHLATLAGAGVGVAGDVLELVGRTNLVVARTRASVLVDEIDRGGFAAFSRLSSAEQADLLTALIDARLRLDRADGLVALGPEDQRWLQLGDRLLREGAEAARKAGAPAPGLDALLTAGRLKAADPRLSAALPPAIRERVPIELDPDLAGNTVEVRYLRDASGLITDVRMRVGPAASATDVAQHAKTAQYILRYSGLSGRVRRLLDQLGSWIGRHGNPPIGSRAWEAKLEVEKLPGIIRDRLERLRRGRLDADAESDMRAEIAYLEEQLDEHQTTLHQMDLGDGVGFVAAKARPWADRKKTAGEAFDKRSAFTSLEEAIDAKMNPESAGWAAIDAGQIRKWGPVIEELHKQLDGPDKDRLLAELLEDLPAGYSQRKYDNFRHDLRERIIKRLIDGHRGREQIDALRRFMDLQPDKDSASRGALFAAYRRARLDASRTGGITDITELPDASKALPNGRYADGAINVAAPINGGPPKGRYLFDDKGGNDPFDPKQARDYSASIVNGRMTTTNGLAYDGLVYIFQREDAARAAAKALERQDRMHVAFFDDDGALRWVARSPNGANPQ